MGDRIRANISTMSREFADMENLQKAAQNSLDELVNAIHALNGSWEGMAHDALVSVFNYDQESMQGAKRKTDFALLSFRHSVALCTEFAPPQGGAFFVSFPLPGAARF